MKGDNKTLSDAKRNCNMMKDKNQQILTTVDEQLLRWVEHFKEI
jgi:hypothetical protein